MGVAFQDAAIHEGARVPLVRVADDELPLTLHLGDEAPLEPGGVSRTATPPQTALGDGVHHVDRLQLPQGVVERLVPVGGDVVLNLFGINLPAVLQDDRHLAGEEGVAEIRLAGGGDAAARQGGDDGWGVGRSHLFIKDVFGDHSHQGSAAAQAEAAHPDDGNTVGQSGGGDGIIETLLDGLGV